MKRTTILMYVVILLVATAAMAQNGNSDNWRIRGDNGELVKVLPPPAMAKADTSNPTFAPVNDGGSFLQTSLASYGTVPGHLDNHGGGVMASNNKVFSIFYTADTANKLQSTITGFIGAFSGTSPGMTTLGQYGVASTISNSGTYTDPTNTAPRSISDSQIQSYIGSLFTAGKVAVDTSTIYGVYLPQGTKSTNGSSASCRNYCGYHGSFTYSGKTIKYAVYPYLDCSGCSLSGASVNDMITVVTSHEIREALTDPVNAWWETASGYEADDKCAWHNLYRISGYLVQPEFSNSDTAPGQSKPGACVFP
ncbi:MAG TPA: hypothetical protein VF824_13695 [Thermoanaerobaculia bacterium]|jgi:hypothetical protein